LEIVTPATVLAKYERLIANAIRRKMADREFLAWTGCSTGTMVGRPYKRFDSIVC
jgi:hypothetical protein